MSASRLLVPSALSRRVTSSILRPQLLRSSSPIVRRALATPANSLIRPTQTTTLPNGLSVATEYSPYLQTATVGIWIDAGSRAETDATSGTAHFLEHLAFKGTTSRNQTQLELEIENMGAHLNAYTAREQTVYYARCFKQDAPACVDIISDILQNSKFEENAIEREREVILREQEEVDKQYEEVVFDHLHATAFPGQPLGRTILGPKENILSIKRNDLVEYINKNYRADRMVLVSAGGVPHEDVVKLAEKHFGKIPPSGSYTNLGDSSAKVTPKFVGSEVRLRDDTMQHAHIALAVEGVGHKHPDYWTMLVMQAIVGNWDRALGSAPHLGSRFSSIVAKNGLANSFMSFSTSYSDTGLWGIYFVTENRVQIDDLVHFCLREWCRLSMSVSEAEVERAKAQLRASLLLSLDSTTPVAEDIGRQLVTTGRRMSPEEIEKVVGGVTVADVRRVANEKLWDKDLAISALGPIEGLLDYQRIRTDMTTNAW